MSMTMLGSRDALIVVDVQKDFCPGGALPVPDGDEVVAPLNDWIEDARRAGAVVVASRDWHPRGHPSFHGDQGPWPQHCVQNEAGAQFHGDLRIPPEALIVSKGVRFDRDQLSAFDETGLAHALKRRGVRRVWIGGLALDVCVRATALDAVRAGFETHVVRSASRAIEPEDEAKTLQEMREAGVVIDS
jgi:nicotinamidase/pyrazinamidase